jgi:hypothetical protein
MARLALVLKARIKTLDKKRRVNQKLVSAPKPVPTWALDSINDNESMQTGQTSLQARCLTATIHVVSWH